MESNSTVVLVFSKSNQQQYLAFRKSTPGVAFLGSMLNVFLVKIHGTIHVSNAGFIYGACYLGRFFGGYYWRYMGCFCGL